MKVLRFAHADRTQVGILAGRRVVSLSSGPGTDLLARKGVNPPANVLDILALPKPLAATVTEWARTDTTATHPLDEVTILPPLYPGKTIAIGRNYREHAAEGDAELPRWPRLFPKWSSSIIADGESIVKPATTDALDWEVELAVVIGRPASRVAESDALDHVAGYTILNDVSARDIQFDKPEQLALAKNYRTFAPFGPWIATADEFTALDEIRLRTWVNDVLKQDGNTRDLIFTVPYLISFVSSVMDLEPGDVISTGTPAGVGAFRTPPEALQAGDEIRMTLDDVIELRNDVIEEAAIAG